MTALGPSPTAVAEAARAEPGCCAPGSVPWAGRRGPAPAPTPLPASQAATAPPRPVPPRCRDGIPASPTESGTEVAIWEPRTRSAGLGGGGACSYHVAASWCPRGGAGLCKLQLSVGWRPLPSSAQWVSCRGSHLMLSSGADACALFFPKGPAMSVHCSCTHIFKTLRVVQCRRKVKSTRLFVT